MSKRRTDAVGEPMLVNLPKTGYTSTGEGGLSFFLLVKEKEVYDERRNVTCEGTMLWRHPDVCLSGDFGRDVVLDAGVLIGSTGLSLLSDETGEYFVPKYRDLTVKGQQLHDLLGTIYKEVHIVTLLDT